MHPFWFISKYHHKNLCFCFVLFFVKLQEKEGSISPREEKIYSSRFGGKYSRMQRNEWLMIAGQCEFQRKVSCALLSGQIPKGSDKLQRDWEDSRVERSCNCHPDSLLGRQQALRDRMVASMYRTDWQRLICWIMGGSSRYLPMP